MKSLHRVNVINALRLAVIPRTRTAAYVRVIKGSVCGLSVFTSPSDTTRSRKWNGCVVSIHCEDTFPRFSLKACIKGVDDLFIACLVHGILIGGKMSLVERL
jgi:hypothetical protein